MIKLILSFAFLFGSLAASAEEWKGRTIYQLLTDRFARNDGRTQGCSNLGNYCGGGYKGMINHLDYITGMGFDAVWISPIIENRQGGYHGYWGRNLYNLNQNFGSEQDFIDFVNACHQRGVWVMVDVVGNHMGNLDTNFNVNTPFNSAQHYHDFCIISDQDFAQHNQDRIQNCRLASLADLKQQNDWVRTTLLSWIKNLVQKYHIDGLRIDTVPEVPKWFWSQFQEAAGVYAVGEVFDGSMDYVAGYVGALNACLNYPFFFWMRNIFFNTVDMYQIRGYYSEWRGRLSTDKLKIMANFVDNHDNARVLSWVGSWEDKKKKFKALNVMALTSLGIPIVYYGTEQYYAGGNDPNNRETLWNTMDKGSEMYSYLRTVIQARKQHNIWEEDQIQRYVDHDFYAFSRGKFLVAVTNQVNRDVRKTITYHPFNRGDVICNIFYPTQDCMTVDSGVNVVLLQGEAKIYVLKS